MELLDISWMERLIAEYFPHSELRIQYHMASVLSDFPNRKFYDARLQSAPKTLQPLKSALRKGLHGIIAQTIPYFPNRKAYKTDATDAQARLHWLEMPVATGDNVSKKGKSTALLLHIRIFMSQVFPDLQALFGANMHKEVMVIAAYGHALAQYQDEFHKHQETNKSDDSHYPRVLGVDAAQGQYAEMVIIDASMQWADQGGKLLRQ